MIIAQLQIDDLDHIVASLASRPILIETLGLVHGIDNFTVMNTYIIRYFYRTSLVR